MKRRGSRGSLSSLWPIVAPSLFFFLFKTSIYASVADANEGSATAVATVGGPVGKRAWAPEDSIAFEYIVRNQESPTDLTARRDEGVVLSPDGTHMFILTWHGDLACDCNEYVLRVYAIGELTHSLALSKKHSTKALTPPPQPLRVVAIRAARSESSYPGISEAHWINTDQIVFVAVEGHGNRNLQRLNVRSGRIDSLTDPLRNFAGGYAIENSLVVYTAASSTPFPAIRAYPAIPLGDEELRQFLDPLTQNWTAAIYASNNGTHTPPIALAEAYVPGMPSISPNRQFAIMQFWPKDEPIPKHWASYKGIARTNITRFMLLDLQKHTARPLLDAPTGISAIEADSAAMTNTSDRESSSYWIYRVRPTVFWSADSTHAVLVNTALPLDADAKNRVGNAFVADVEISSGKLIPLEALYDRENKRGVASTTWLPKQKHLLIQHRTLNEELTSGTTYSFEHNQWVARSVPSSITPLKQKPPRLPTGISIFIRQNANLPPCLVASDGSVEFDLLDPNPALQTVWRVPVIDVQWIENDGSTEHAGLLLPRERSGSHPVPLVIQAYSYHPDLFLPDGHNLTAEAAQPLVGAGIAVLLMNLPHFHEETPRESQRFIDRIDKAVDTLAAQGMIDPDRVGLVGFSQGAVAAYYTVTHPGKTKLAAAVIADGASYNYTSYVAKSALSTNKNVARYETMSGGHTFWEAKSAWTQHAPGFNVEKVRTPVLFTDKDKEDRLGLFRSIETIGAFRLNGRPYEYLLFPDGDHELVRPSERLASLQYTVDWMLFWLKGAERRGSETVARYARWRTLREQQVDVLTEMIKNGESVAPLPTLRPANPGDSDVPLQTRACMASSCARRNEVSQ